MLDDVTLRLARQADARTIAILSRERIERGLPWSWTPARVQRAIADPDTNVVVAPDAADGVLGFAIMVYGDERAHLSLLAVRSTHARRGIGRAMLGWLEAAALTAGIGRVVLEARARNTEARAFYRALGYREVRLMPGYYQGREAAVCMSRNLRSRRLDEVDADPPDESAAG